MSIRAMNTCCLMKSRTCLIGIYGSISCIAEVKIWLLPVATPRCWAVRWQRYWQVGISRLRCCRSALRKRCAGGMSTPILKSSRHRLLSLLTIICVTVVIPKLFSLATLLKATCQLFSTPYCWKTFPNAIRSGTRLICIILPRTFSLTFVIRFRRMNLLRSWDCQA